MLAKDTNGAQARSAPRSRYSAVTATPSRRAACRGSRGGPGLLKKERALQRPRESPTSAWILRLSVCSSCS
ncbi:unnamed protein product [Prorocentrum cordatum]|uniref:Uncharacterized protein n=1 Tax=Prorocentrum cordatum TaxID=2364126 RepID=A0ABN9U915_9DINO|nr:unnamed protein product [Polarella glacialis]